MRPLLHALGSWSGRPADSLCVNHHIGDMLAWLQREETRADIRALPGERSLGL